MYQVYARDGWGSVLVEALLAIADERYERIDIDPHGNPADRARLAAVNPLVQLPTIVTPDADVMTESGAIALYIAERARSDVLAPPPGDPLRATYLRWQIYLVANVYASYMIDDAPQRWADGSAAEQAVKDRANAYRHELMAVLERNAGGPWFLGDRFSTIDVFLSVMTRWAPRREWYATNSPKLHAIAVKVDGLPALREIWRRNFGPDA